MSYQEKRIIVNLISGISILAAYGIYVLNQTSSGMVAPGDLKFWAGAMLTFIGIGIVATIVIQIVFHVLLSVSIAVSKTIQNETIDENIIEKSIGSEMVEDEMDKLIDMKSNQIGFIFAGIGFVWALIALVLNYSPVVMLNILFISFNVGSLSEGVAQLYFYRRGV
jgi:hypothetical protein